MEENKQPTAAITSKTLATKLINEGFELLNIGTDKKTNKPCFIFYNTPEFKAKRLELVGQTDRDKDNNGLTDEQFETLKVMIECTIAESMREVVQQILVASKTEIRKMLTANMSASNE